MTLFPGLRDFHGKAFCQCFAAENAQFSAVNIRQQILLLRVQTPQGKGSAAFNGIFPTKSHQKTLFARGIAPLPGNPFLIGNIVIGQRIMIQAHIGSDFFHIRNHFCIPLSLFRGQRPGGRSQTDAGAHGTADPVGVHHNAGVAGARAAGVTADGNPSGNAPGVTLDALRFKILPAEVIAAAHNRNAVMTHPQVHSATAAGTVVDDDIRVNGPEFLKKGVKTVVIMQLGQAFAFGFVPLGEIGCRIVVEIDAENIHLRGIDDGAKLVENVFSRCRICHIDSTDQGIFGRLQVVLGVFFHSLAGGNCSLEFKPHPEAHTCGLGLGGQSTDSVGENIRSRTPITNALEPIRVRLCALAQSIPACVDAVGICMQVIFLNVFNADIVSLGVDIAPSTHGHR